MNDTCRKLREQNLDMNVVISLISQCKLFAHPDQFSEVFITFLSLYSLGLLCHYMKCW